MTRWGYIFFNMCIIIPNANAQKLLTPSLLSSCQYAWLAISDHNGEIGSCKNETFLDIHLAQFIFISFATTSLNVC